MTTISDKFAATETFLTEMPSKDMTSFALLIVASLALHEWAFIHYAACVLTVYQSWTNNVGGAMAGLAGESSTNFATQTYPADTSRIYIQHGINLGIAGFFADLAIVALILNWDAAPYIALLPFLVDVGYFIAIDLPHFGSIIGVAQTYIISVGFICVSAFTYLQSDQGELAMAKMVPMII